MFFVFVFTNIITAFVSYVVACDAVADYWKARVGKLSEEVTSLRKDLEDCQDELEQVKRTHVIPRLSFENLQAMRDSGFASGHSSRSASPAIRRVCSEVQMGPVDPPTTSE
jgi:hypothetical protein